jgi:hypothetical protein
MGAGITELETTSTLGPIVADPETPFMDKYGPTCPGEGLTLVALPLTEKLSRFNAKKKKGKKNTILVLEETKGIHMLTIFIDGGIFLLTLHGAFLNLLKWRYISSFRHFHVVCI